MPRTLVVASLVLLFTISPICTQSHNGLFKDLRFLNDAFTGYISENVASPLPNQPVNTNQRQNRNLVSSINHNKQQQPEQSIYVRFIDKLKPSFTFVKLTATTTTQCHSFNTHAFNMTLSNEPEDMRNIFELEPRYDCFESSSTQACVCYFKLRLVLDQIDELNREAKPLYVMKVSHMHLAYAHLNVHLLDDNDLEPMFDQNEYTFDLDLSKASQFGDVIGSVWAEDPDLDSNSNVRYYMNSDCYNNSELFGVNWMNGDIYLKRPMSNFFQDEEKTRLG